MKKLAKVKSKEIKSKVAELKLKKKGLKKDIKTTKKDTKAIKGINKALKNGKVKKAVKLSRQRSDKLNRTQIIDRLVTETELDKKQVAAVLNSLTELALNQVGKKGPGSFMLPGLLKIVTINKPATKARKGINPFTKEPCVFKAKPATVKVRVRPMKKLKDAALS